MTSTMIHHQGPSLEENFGLQAVGAHNGATPDRFPGYQDSSKGLGIYDVYAQQFVEEAYLNNPPTPRSNTASDGVQTRSGRSTTRRTDSPFSTSKSRVSKSPMPRSKKDKKSKLDKSKTPKLTGPLSVLTMDMATPMKDMDSWVNRSAETRRQEVEKRNGYVTRPMNSFMLYRSAYAERTKAWCTQNNHQVVSSVSGESWPMEPQEVRDQFKEWAKLERANHQAAHPDYKFSPSKATNKRRKGDFSDDEAELSSVDGDPDGEYRSGGRNVRQRRHAPAVEQTYRLNETVGFDSHPYYSQQTTGYEQSQYQFANLSRPLPSNVPSNVGYDVHGNPYDTHTGQYIQHSVQQNRQYHYGQDIHVGQIPTPRNAAQQSIGGYGLPGGTGDDIFTTSRTSTPMQQYATYGHHPVYSQHAVAYQQQQAYPQHGQSQQLYEHQQWLLAHSQPQTAIDPSLEAELASMHGHGSARGHGDNHFESVIGDIPTYFEESTSPNQALAPEWNPEMDDLS